MRTRHQHGQRCRHGRQTGNVTAPDLQSDQPVQMTEFGMGGKGCGQQLRLRDGSCFARAGKQAWMGQGRGMGASMRRGRYRDNTAASAVQEISTEHTTASTTLHE